MINRLGLMSTWDKFDCDFTHLHTDNKSVSKIDHFICNERLFNILKNVPRYMSVIISLDIHLLF